eukprot:scaffold86168_cov35-Phaeocystis_antarctica.AAC.1
MKEYLARECESRRGLLHLRRWLARLCPAATVRAMGLTSGSRKRGGVRGLVGCAAAPRLTLARKSIFLRASSKERARRAR